MYTEEELRIAVKESLSCGETLTKLGRKRSGASYTCLRNNINKYQIDTSHFKAKAFSVDKGKRHWREILTFDKDRVNRRDTSQLVRALLEFGVSHSCKECGLSESWNGKPITLQVDHIDGNWKDNRSSNLRFLCPNCHSQQKTSKNKKLKYYCKCGKQKSKNSECCASCGFNKPRPHKRKVERPDLKTILKDVKELGYCGAGRKYGVSDNAVRKWIKAYNKPD